MKKCIKCLLVATALTLAVVPATAGERSFGDIYVECGLGGIIGGAVGGSTGNVLAVVTNVTWDLGTTAISSNISSDSTCSNKKALAANFINQGYNQIEQEIAMGNGEYIQTLAALTKKDNQTDANFIASLRTEFSTVVASNDYNDLSHYQKAEKLFNIVK